MDLYGSTKRKQKQALERRKPCIIFFKNINQISKFPTIYFNSLFRLNSSLNSYFLFFEIFSLKN